MRYTTRGPTPKRLRERTDKPCASRAVIRPADEEGARKTPPRHIVAVVGLVTDDVGRVLMIESPSRGWELPGGQVEEGETLPDALQREIREETGIESTIGRLAVVHSNLAPPAKVILGFQCRAIGGQIATGEESLAVEWVHRGDVLTRIIHPAVAERARALIAEERDVRYCAYRPTPYEIVSRAQL